MIAQEKRVVNKLQKTSVIFISIEVKRPFAVYITEVFTNSAVQSKQPVSEFMRLFKIYNLR